MGCDIHAYAEVNTGGVWALALTPLPDVTRPWDDPDEVFPDHRDYGLFGFLANVRNYSEVPTIVAPRGLPDDVSDATRAKHAEEGGDAHGETWITLAELLTFDYEQTFWDRRVVKQTGPNSFNGAARAEEGEGKHVTFREFLGTEYFDRLNSLTRLGYPPDVRVVMWFDN